MSALPTRKCSHCGERVTLTPRRGRNSGRRPPRAEAPSLHHGARYCGTSCRHRGRNSGRRPPRAEAPSLHDGARYCGTSCRQAAHEDRRTRARAVLLVDVRYLLALISHGNGREARTLVRRARGGVFATELHKPKETRLITIIFPLHTAGLLVLLGRELLGHGMRPHVEFGQPLLAERLKRLALGLERARLALGGVELHKRPFALGQLVGRARLASAPVLSWFRPARHLGYLTGSMAARPFYLRPPAGAPARARHHYSF